MITLLHGDCRQVLPKLAASSARLVLTSPPYNIGKAYERKATLADYLADMTVVAGECVRVLADGGSVCWQVGNWVDKRNGSIVPLDAAMLPVFQSLGLICRNRIIWTFSHGLHCKNRFSGRHETILWLTKGEDYVFNLDAVRVPQKWPGKRHFKGPKKGQLSCNPLGKNPGDVWEIGNVKHNHPEKTAHPCQFPEELARRLVLSLTNPGDLVVDPFAGSGTVGRVAAAAGRDAVLIEREPAYITLIQERCSLPAAA